MANKKNFLSQVFNPVINFFEKTKKERKEKQKLKVLPEYKMFEKLQDIDGSLENFENFIRKSGKIGIILGARGTGKSALGMRILENIKAEHGKKVYTMGFNKEKLPKWINVVYNVGEITNNSFLLVDEGGIQFSSRSAMSSVNKLLTELLLISRHKSISILFITQNSANIEINTLRQADYLLLKPSSLLQLDFERKKIREIYKNVEKKFNKFKNIATTYIYSDVYRGFVKNSLPGFWTESLSKSFARK